ncbi:hypothetical protein TELCIR_20122 [Teladorsagia circumcincta]|uniref:Uncharacterized protein n=1 Tax=Teladorsagia circumcincta TaxID=45464 RepID=A0A2G9TKD8_TELCI|nr:hypothetical protein TELCIR_20122 [Teladorsagia circumcincta]
MLCSAKQRIDQRKNWAEFDTGYSPNDWSGIPYSQEIPYSFRVIHAHDVIPHSPPRGYHNYRHHKSEVFYNNDMTTDDYIECDEQESKACSDQNINVAFNDHHRYYNVYIYRWGAIGCTGDPVNPPTTPPKQA